RADRDTSSSARDRLDTVRASALDEDAIRARLDDDPCAARVRILEPGHERRLLRAELAAEPAVAADTVLVAAAHVARHRGHVPAERLQPAAHDLVARRRQVVVGV